MNSIASQRSALIAVVADLNETIDFSYESQIDSPVGVILSDVFERDVRR